MLWLSIFDVARRRIEPVIIPELAKQLFYLLLPDHYSSALVDGNLPCEKLQELLCEGSESHFLAPLLPVPIASLIVKGYFHTALVLARSPLLAEVFSGDVPGKEWVGASEPLHMQALGRVGGG